MESSKVTTQPVKEVGTVTEAKNYAKIDTNADDSLVADLIVAARESVERFLNRALITQTLEYTIDAVRGRDQGWDALLGEGVHDFSSQELLNTMPRTIKLPRDPIQSITSVTSYDTANAATVYATSNYFLDIAGGRFVLNESATYPTELRTKASIVIQYVAGYGDNPADVPRVIKQGILGAFQTMYDDRSICDLPEHVCNMMQPYRVMSAYA